MAYQYPNTPGTLLQATPVQFSGFTSLNFVITAKAATLQPNHILPISRNAQPRRPRHPDLLRRLSPARIRSRSAATDDRRRGKLVSALFHTIARETVSAAQPRVGRDLRGATPSVEQIARRVEMDLWTSTTGAKLATTPYMLCTSLRLLGLP